MIIYPKASKGFQGFKQNQDLFFPVTIKISLFPIANFVMSLA